MTLGIQLKNRRPDTSILIAEKRDGPAPEAAFKVGESTVELSAHYFAQVEHAYCRIWSGTSDGETYFVIFHGDVPRREAVLQDDVRKYISYVPDRQDRTSSPTHQRGGGDCDRQPIRS